jgi:hypothetical protein
MARHPVIYLSQSLRQKNAPAFSAYMPSMAISAAKQSLNPEFISYKDCFVALLLAMTVVLACPTHEIG